MVHHRADLAPAEAPTVPVSGPQPLDDRRCLTGILFALKTGIPWEDLPQEMGCGSGMLAAPARLAAGRRVGAAARHAAGASARGRQDRLVAGRGRLRLRARGGRGEKTGPNPTDRRKLGSKHHVITDARGIPLATTLTGANRHDVTQLMTLVEAIPAVRGKRSRPRRRPDRVQGDRAYDSQPRRNWLCSLGTASDLARRGTEHGSGLGGHRWVVERTLSWLHQPRRLRTRYDRRDDIHESFMAIGASLICWPFLINSLC